VALVGRDHRTISTPLKFVSAHLEPGVLGWGDRRRSSVLLELRGPPRAPVTVEISGGSDSPLLVAGREKLRMLAVELWHARNAGLIETNMRGDLFIHEYAIVIRR
jgi:hypothetical protein